MRIIFDQAPDRLPAVNGRLKTGVFVGFVPLEKEHIVGIMLQNAPHDVPQCGRAVFAVIHP